MSMRIDDNILSQIYMSQNYDAQPLESEEKKVKDPKAGGQKTEGEKPLEDRVIVQIGKEEKNFNLASADFRIGLYNFLKEKDGLKDELAMIRQRLNLTENGEAAPDENKKIDTRSVINEIFARPENVNSKINDALMGVVKFPKDVRTEILHAIWRQRDNPGIRKFLQTGGSSQDLAAICKLTLDSMEAHSRKDFAHRMVMSYLKGFTLGTISSPIAFSAEFEKSFEEDQVFREERKGVEDRRTVELKSLEVATEEALAELEDKTQTLLPKSDEKEPTVGDKYLKGQYDDVKKGLQRFCASRKTKLESADAEGMEKLLSDDFKKELGEKVSKSIKDMNDFHQRAKQLDLLAEFKPDFGKVCGAKPNDPLELAYYEKARHQFEADYKDATEKAEGDMWKHLNNLTKNDLKNESLKTIWDNHYCADWKAFTEAGKSQPNMDLPPLLDPKEYFTAGKKGNIKKNQVFKQQDYSNTCYMTSFVNGLLMQDKGVGLLKGFIQDKEEENATVFKFPGYLGDEVEVKLSDITAQKKDENIKKEDEGKYADFEWATHIAHLKDGGLRGCDFTSRLMSEMQDQQTLAETFGYQLCGEPAGFANGDVKSAISAWVTMKKVMETTPDAILTVKTGGDNRGHYMTVTGFYKTDNDFGVNVLDSAGGCTHLSMINGLNHNANSLYAYRKTEMPETGTMVKLFANEVSKLNLTLPLDKQKEIAAEVMKKVPLQKSEKDNAPLDKTFLKDDGKHLTFDISKLADSKLNAEVEKENKSKGDVISDMMGKVCKALDEAEKAQNKE